MQGFGRAAGVDGQAGPVRSREACGLHHRSGVARVGWIIDSRYRARRIPSHTDSERPSGHTSHSRTTQSVSGADDAVCSIAVTGPATERSDSSTFDVYVSTRSSIGR